MRGGRKMRYKVDDRVKIVPVGRDNPGQFAGKKGRITFVNKDASVYGVLLDDAVHDLAFMDVELVLLVEVEQDTE
jgi:hypothetical protein